MLANFLQQCIIQCIDDATTSMGMTRLRTNGLPRAGMPNLILPKSPNDTRFIALNLQAPISIANVFNSLATLSNYYLHLYQSEPEKTAPVIAIMSCMRIWTQLLIFVLANDM